ncbi:MAG: DNA polymerase I [Actinobacteria bacterium]|nr:DNA polymerase I [Actinomycetota bacterium]
MPRPLLLIDGNSLTYRAFFALPTDLMTASGQVTNAVTGFCAMLVTLLREHEPDGIAVAFDLPGSTFRHERLPSYKANRDRQPDILYEQLGLVRELVEALGLKVVDAEGFEADDVLATLAATARDAGREAIIVTGDRDSYQLVEDPYVRVLYNKRGVSDYALYDEAGIEERTGVSPGDYVLYAALRGDPSDNLPGVPGVGEKTAAKLVNTYRGLDGIFGAAADQTPKLRQNLEENEDLVRLNTEMMVLVRDVPLGLEADDLQRGPVDVDAAVELFDRLELRTARVRLGELLGVDFSPDGSGGSGGAADRSDGGEIQVDVQRPKDAASACEALAGLPAGPIGLDGGDPDGDGGVMGDGLALSAGEGAVVWLERGLLGSPDVSAAMMGLMDEDAEGCPGVAFHDGKPLVKALRALGVDVVAPVLDTRLAAYLLDPADSSFDLEQLLERHSGHRIPSGGASDGQLDLGGDTTDSAVGASLRARSVALLVEPMLAAIDAQGIARLNTEVELPLLRVLARMEEVGVGVDVAELTRLRDQLTAECERLRAAVHEAAGEEFNVNSTKQLRVILFEKLGLTPGKKTKTGYSTNAATLERLRDDHPVVEFLLAYREVEKLRSTYGEGLLAEVGEGDRIRATFNQTVARTGRLSSDAPNLHNIPVRTEAGRAFRRAFVPAEGYTLLVADYNQIELRCIAHLAEDPGLIAAFEAGDDIHTAVAARTWNVDPADVTFELRSRAKMVAYGLAYGMEAYGLSQRLDIPVEEATEILDGYFAAFPAVREYMDRTVAEARDRGYTETLFGRRRRIPELSSPNFNIRQAGERQAMNAGIQGLAADIFKVALVRLDRHLEDADMESRLILQVHDEVILEVVPDERDEALTVVPEILSGAFDLRVELAVDVATGDTWADAKA